MIANSVLEWILYRWGEEAGCSMVLRVILFSSLLTYWFVKGSNSTQAHSCHVLAMPAEVCDDPEVFEPISKLLLID